MAVSNQHTPSRTSLCLHLTGEVHVGGQEHFYMETQTVLVIPKTEDKELDIYVSTQDPAHVQVRSRIAPTQQLPKSIMAFKHYSLTADSHLPAET